MLSTLAFIQNAYTNHATLRQLVSQSYLKSQHAPIQHQETSSLLKEIDCLYRPEGFLYLNDLHTAKPIAENLRGRCSHLYHYRYRGEPWALKLPELNTRNLLTNEWQRYRRSAVTQLHHEITLLSYLKHRCIVPCVGSHTSPRATIMVMPFYSVMLDQWRKDLQQQRKQQRSDNPIDDLHQMEKNVVSILYDISTALVYLKGFNLVHRDLKIHDIALATGQHRELYPVILDFGQAWFDGCRIPFDTSPCELILPPEFGTSVKADYSYDVWAFGIIALQLTRTDLLNHTRKPLAQRDHQAFLIGKKDYLNHITRRYSAIRDLFFTIQTERTDRTEEEHTPGRAFLNPERYIKPLTRMQPRDIVTITGLMALTIDPRHRPTINQIQAFLCTAKKALGIDDDQCISDI